MCLYVCQFEWLRIGGEMLWGGVCVCVMLEWLGRGGGEVGMCLSIGVLAKRLGGWRQGRRE